MGHAPKITAQEENNSDPAQAVRETERNFSTDWQLLMNEATNDPTLFKTLVCLERKHQDQIPTNTYLTKRDCLADSTWSLWKTKLSFARTSGQR